MAQLSVDQLQRNIHSYLQETGAVRTMKGHVRALVLGDIAKATGGFPRAATSRGGALHGSVVAGTADALVEAYLQASGRSNTHSVFTAEADLPSSGANASAELGQLLGLSAAAVEGQDVLLAVIAELLQTAHERRSGALASRVSTGVQASPEVAATTLEEKLAWVDANTRYQHAQKAGASRDAWEARMRMHEATLKDQLARDSALELARWKERELVAMRREEEEKFRVKLHARIAALAETEQASQHQISTERFKVEQLRREVELRGLTLDTEKATSARLAAAREQSVEAARKEADDLRHKLAEAISGIATLEREAASARSETRQYRQRAGELEVDLRLAQSELERVRRTESARTAMMSDRSDALALRALHDQQAAATAAAEAAALRAVDQRAAQRASRKPQRRPMAAQILTDDSMSADSPKPAAAKSSSVPKPSAASATAPRAASAAQEPSSATAARTVSDQRDEAAQANAARENVRYDDSTSGVSSRSLSASVAGGADRVASSTDPGETPRTSGTRTPDEHAEVDAVAINIDAENVAAAATAARQSLEVAEDQARASVASDEGRARSEVSRDCTAALAQALASQRAAIIDAAIAGRDAIHEEWQSELRTLGWRERQDRERKTIASRPEEAVTFAVQALKRDSDSDTSSVDLGNNSSGGDSDW